MSQEPEDKHRKALKFIELKKAPDQKMIDEDSVKSNKIAKEAIHADDGLEETGFSDSGGTTKNESNSNNDEGCKLLNFIENTSNVSENAKILENMFNVDDFFDKFNNFLVYVLHSGPDGGVKEPSNVNTIAGGDGDGDGNSDLSQLKENKDQVAGGASVNGSDNINFDKDIDWKDVQDPILLEFKKKFNKSI